MERPREELTCDRPIRRHPAARLGPTRGAGASAVSDQRLLDLIGADAIAYWRTLGIAVESAERGHVRLRLPMRAELGTRRPEVMHGGAIASLLDAAAGAATATLRGEDDGSWAGQATTDLNVSFPAAATTDVVAEARVLRAGRALAFVAVEVLDAAGTLVAAGRVTFAIIRREASRGG